jgi:DNA-binding response OmpR family regulator
VTPSEIPHQQSRGGVLEGLRILVAEDEFLLATQLEDELLAAGCDVLGPYPSVAEARQAVRDMTFDLALLDVNLRGELIFSVADELRARAIPILLLSGYSPANLPERFRTLPRVAKPYDQRVLLREIRRAVGK